MKKGTEIKIELQDDGSWIATSPDYPGWSASGTDSFGSADVAGRHLESWVAEHTCRLCEIERREIEAGRVEAIPV